MIKCSYQFSVLFWPVTWHEEGRCFSKAVEDLQNPLLREGIQLSLQNSASRRETVPQCHSEGEEKMAEKLIPKFVATESILTWAMTMLCAWFKKTNLSSFEDPCLNFSALVKSSIRTKLLARVSQDRGERNSLPPSKWMISYRENMILLVFSGSLLSCGHGARCTFIRVEDPLLLIQPGCSLNTRVYATLSPLPEGFWWCLPLSVFPEDPGSRLASGTRPGTPCPPHFLPLCTLHWWGSGSPPCHSLRQTRASIEMQGKARRVCV